MSRLQPPGRIRRHARQVPQWPLDGGITVVLFAGLGGACAGLEEAGCPVAVANNHDDVALAAHAELHPHTRHVRGDIFDVDPLAATGGRRVKNLWASPDCFPPGTLVLTDDGLKPIEEVRVGDLVLTHRGRWRRVVKAWTQHSETVEVRGYGHYGLITTPGHQFYSKRITRRYDGRNPKTGKRLGAIRTLVENPYWPAAKAMAEKLWATPRAFPAASIPICPDVAFSEDFFYLLGRWLGDGSINKGDVEICCGRAEADQFRALLQRAPLRDADGEPVPHREIDRPTTLAFVWGRAALADWLRREAGDLCETKRVPLWCLSMQRAWREALLRGYLEADGYEGGRRTVVSSVSKALALGMRLLATTLGHAASLFRDDGGAGEIDGRAFMGRDRYTVAWTAEPQRETTFTDTLHRYFPVREVVPAGERLVVSLSVEEDESFIADGIVVHNCRDHSIAKGDAPRSPRVRSLPWQVCRWAGKTGAEVIMVENVREIRGWGPLIAKRCPTTGRVVKLDGTAAAKGEHVPVREQQLVRDRRRQGRSFRRWVQHLRGLGYAYEDRDLNCADYGVPTSRRRFFAVARRDGLPIGWPARTHAPRDEAARLGLLPWRAAAEIIDWSLPIPSIFNRKRPLVAATERRIAVGFRRYVLENASPFLVPVTHQGGPRVHGLDEPLRTLTTAHRGEFAVVAPTLVQTGYGERTGQAPRCLDISAPIGTMVAGGAKHALVAAWMAQHNLGAVGVRADAPLSTLTTAGTQQQVCAAYLAHLRGTGTALSAQAPVPTLTAGGEHVAAVAAFLTKYYGQGGVAQGCDEPLHTLVQLARFGVVAVAIAGEPYVVADIAMRMLAPEEAAAAHELTLPKLITIGGRRRPLTKSESMRLIGNSVPKRMARLLAEANIVHALEAAPRARAVA